ncbi:transposase [Nonomuraea sp. CA-141351]|uniref:transposase n=1 Tax=Nonomuraea sp. CA-141351 TaxID=3239996 RepID=UPI003D8E2763
MFYLPSYAPELNPTEGVWSHLKRSLGKLASAALDQLGALIRTRPKPMQHRSSLLNAFIARTGLTFTSGAL